MKPKPQTKQQLMEQNILTLTKANGAQAVKIHELNQLNERYEGVIKKLNKSLNRFTIAIVVGTILGFAVGLYTGHKITQRAKPETIYVGTGFRNGYEKGFKSALKENIINTYTNGYTDGFRDGNLGNKSKASNWQPKTVKVIYRQIHHTKGAERLRL